MPTIAFALVAGFQRHLPKPVDPGVLAATIASVVPRPRLPGHSVE
jgi:hypothetical protein